MILLICSSILKDQEQRLQKMKDDISEEEKSRRLSEIVELQQKMSAERTKLGLHKTHRVLIEGLSKIRSDAQRKDK